MSENNSVNISQEHSGGEGVERAAETADSVSGLAETPEANDSAAHKAAGNLAFLISVIRCGETLSAEEEAHVRKVIYSLVREDSERTAYREALELISQKKYDVWAFSECSSIAKNVLAAYRTAAAHNDPSRA